MINPIHWRAFWYNFGWSDWVAYIDGWIPRLSLTVPLVGYLILFNDTIGKALEFAHLTGNPAHHFGLDGDQRLRFIYFGLILLGLSNFLYRLKRPYAFRFGTNLTEYTRTCLDVFTFEDFVSLHDEIRTDGHFTHGGKYYDSEWDGFSKEARNEGEGTPHAMQYANWDTARGKYGSLLRGMLRETFFRQNIQKRVSLIACVVLSTAGYILLLFPSLDLFFKVVRSTIS